ncbi:F-box/FBD/LRR-repeat protein At1g13570-like [Rhododendron vialii]|uniref:F-box/FBD/LRR-repeat protein At1g13570-like n=1 Tax=Rhododendron vialii TaxID=182163 RepID=UPI00266042B6|nr:F-box/FBD/LRR-repeat protein At1g13570-like [Rhododendron vialii]
MMRNWRSTPDIISNLPSNIMETILKYLPLRDAGRTSVLSRRWRYKWVTLPQLVFQNQFFVSSGDTEKIKVIIYQVLLLHQGPLVEFKLCNPPFGSCLDINNWIPMLSKKNIQEFTLCLDLGPRHELRCDLFSFLRLKHLTLCGCVFKPPPAFKGFTRLVNLNLWNVNITPEMVG